LCSSSAQTAIANEKRAKKDQTIIAVVEYLEVVTAEEEIWGEQQKC
jgi:hypothetical protein